MTGRNLTKISVSACRIAILLVALSFSVWAQGRHPVILIPGLSGSELRHRDTGERIWFKALRSDAEDLRLPISADPVDSHDLLVPGDIVRGIKIAGLQVTDVYSGFLKAMASRGGYHEEKWDSPSEKGADGGLYVFAYDWRLDNVLNARRLVRNIEDLKIRLKRPDLKFDIVAHSMGGLITRYAAMYGDAELSDGRPRVTWAGAKHFDKVVLMGTPNEGSALSLSVLLNGFRVGGMRLDLPFLQDTSRFTAFSMPSAFQLLPAPGALKAFDERLTPVDIDLYDPKTWDRYGWNPIDDKRFVNEFPVAEQGRASVYFTAVLDRAKRLHMALAASAGTAGGPSTYVVGADCGTALDSIVVYRDQSADRWKTLFRPKGFTRSNGGRVTDAELKKIMMAPGDGVVTRRSLEATTQAAKAGTSILGNDESAKFICENHTLLATNTQVQDHIIGLLKGKGSPTKMVAGTQNMAH